MGTKLLNTNRGFTVIEVLIVLVIIGLLAGIAIPTFMRSYDNARDKKVISEMRTIATALGIYRIDNNQIPVTNDYADVVNIMKQHYGNFLLIPARDSWGHKFYYRASGTSEYTLKSLGKDGQEGNPAQKNHFDPNNDIILIDGVFMAVSK